MRTQTAVLLAGLALAAGGCGGDDQSSEPDGQGAQSGAAAGTEAPAEEQAPASGAEDGGGTSITIKDFAYDPADATAKVGDTVTFTNEDSAPHDAKSTDGPSLEVPVMQQGESQSTTVEEAGTIQYICTIHPQMQATLTVTE